MDSLSIDIRASDRVLLKDGNYRVWVTLLEQQFKYQKLWAHVQGTAVRPPSPRVVTPGVAAIAGGAGIAAVAAIAEITQEHVDNDQKKLDGFDASIAKANYIILLNIEQKDVMALHGYDYTLHGTEMDKIEGRLRPGQRTNGDRGPCPFFFV